MTLSQQQKKEILEQKTQKNTTRYKYYNDRLLQSANWGTIIMHSVTGVLFCIGIWNG